MSQVDDLTSVASLADRRQVPLVIASILRPEGTTGVHTHIRELCAYLDEQGLPYELVTPFSWGRALSAPVFAARLPLLRAVPPASVAWYRYWHTTFLREALRRRLAHMGPAIIYAQGPEAARASTQARQRPDQRVVMVVHFLRSQACGWVSKGHIKAGGPISKAIQHSEQSLVPDLDGIVYVSMAAQEEFVSAIPRAAQVPSSVIPNFVRHVEGLSCPGPLADLVTIGSLEREKNQEFILRVLASAKDAGHAYTLDVYGTGSLRRHLERTAARLGVVDQVRFRGYDPAAPSRLRAYRAYVHACPVESGPFALIEALAAGLPILAVNRGGVGELVSDGVEGRHWPADDPVAASRLLIAFLRDEPARKAAGLAARRRFSTSFDSRLVAPRLAAFLYAGSFRTSSAATSHNGRDDRWSG